MLKKSVLIEFCFLKRKKKSVKQVSQIFFFFSGLVSKWQTHISGSDDYQIKETIWILKTKGWKINCLFGVSSRLSFTFCVFQKLNSPTLSVNSEGFIPMLSKLDDCIEYVSSHVSLWQSFTSFIVSPRGDNQTGNNVCKQSKPLSAFCVTDV